MPHAIRVHENGGPEVLRWDEVPMHAPGEGEARIRHTAIGINFSDINVRRGGFYPTAWPLPVILGNEAAGIIEELGSGTSGFKVGDRVAYAGMFETFYLDTGAYSEYRNVPLARLVHIPDDVTDEQAAATLLKGATASLIINRLYKPKPGDTVLVHTGAAGVGMILCQWSKWLGATVISTVGSAAKAELARANGSDHAILYRETDFVAEVERIAPGGVSAVFDGVGNDTFIRSFATIRKFGTAVNYGNASGSVLPLDIQTLALKSLTVSRAGVGGHLEDTESLRAVAGEVFSLVGKNVIRPRIACRYALREAARAHADVESARFSGSLLLIP